MPPAEHWSRRWCAHTVALAILVLAALWRWAVNDYPHYGVGQMASPTKLYHDVLIIAVGYALFVVLAPLLGREPLVFLPLALVVAWAVIGLTVDRGDEWKAQYVHVDYDWQCASG